MTRVNEETQDTRARILAVALEAFAAHGYHATSLRELAERVGVTKTAVLYHFPGKVDILGALADPMLTALDAAVMTAELAEPPRARWVAIEGLLDVWITHRSLLKINLHDLALAAAGPVFERFRDTLLRANAVVAGPNPSFAERVYAAQAIAMLGDPVVLFADAPVKALRAGVLRGVHRLLDGGKSPIGAKHVTRAQAPPRPQRGRPRVMAPEMAEAAQRMLAAGNTASEIAAELGVSRATVYRHLGARLNNET